MLIFNNFGRSHFLRKLTCIENQVYLFDELQFYLFGQIQSSQTGGHPYSDTSHNEIS